MGLWERSFGESKISLLNMYRAKHFPSNVDTVLIKVCYKISCLDDLPISEYGPSCSNFDKKGIYLKSTCLVVLGWVQIQNETKCQHTRHILFTCFIFNCFSSVTPYVLM